MSSYNTLICNVITAQICVELLPSGERAPQQLRPVQSCEGHLNCTGRYEGFCNNFADDFQLLNDLHFFVICFHSLEEDRSLSC